MPINVSPGSADRQELELCRDLARMAKINRTFTVGPDASEEDSESKIVSTFDEAFGEIRERTERSLGVMFDWSFGNQSGVDAIKYLLPNKSVTEHFVQRTIDNLVLQRIAESLYRGYLFEEEYEGPIDVVEVYIEQQASAGLDT
jgi:hypothetical protein